MVVQCTTFSCMLSIQHNRLNVQVGSGIRLPIVRNPEEANTLTPVGLTQTQRSAFEFYDLGLNVFPQPISKKGGLPWKSLQFNRLDRDDSRYGLKTLFAGRANLAVMCGRTSGNLFVIDCETRESLRHHMAQLRRRKIPLWVVQTARGGHIYLRARDGEVHNVAPNILQDAEIKGQQGYVLAPPSIHPSGAVYRWLRREGQGIPIVDSNQVNWLRDQAGNSVFLQITKRSDYVPGQWKKPKVRAAKLSRATQQYLEQGHALAEGSRNNSLFAAACDLAGNNYSHTDALSELLPIARTSGLSEHEIRVTVASAYSKPRTPSRPRTQKRPEQITIWWSMLLWATNHRWQGRTASTDRVLTLALIERAKVHSNENGIFRASIRELAELGRMGTATVRRALERLQKKQIIFKAGHDQTSQASLWKFNQKHINEAQLQMDTLALSPHWLRFSVSIFNSELAERGVMGRSVLYVYTYLILFDGDWLPSTLAEAMGLTVNQVNYALRKLSQLGLIVRESQGWRLVVDDLEEAEAILAPEQGELCRSERRRRRFQRERARFAGRLLYDARMKHEGIAFYEAAFGLNSAQDELVDLLNDPVISLALELGGVLRLEDGRSVAMQPM